jgi:hypothetical protein
MKASNHQEQLIDEANTLLCWLSSEAEIAFIEGNYQRSHRLSKLCDRALFRLLRRQQIIKENHYENLS